MRKFIFPLDNGTTLTINPPSVRLLSRWETAKTSEENFSAIAEICNNNDEKIPVTVDYVLDGFSIFDFKRFTADFPKWINSEKDSDPN